VNAISGKATPGGPAAIIGAVNAAVAGHGLNRAAVIEACAQILAEDIVSIGPNGAAEIRSGVMCLIDSYAMRAATEGENG
jgi:hypothetical protein